MVNNHIHIFTTDDIPNKFLPLGLVRWLAKKDRKVFNWILHNLNPFADNDVLDRYLDFVRVGKLGGQKEIFENIMKEYPKETEFNVLTMDMSFMGAGKVPRNYELQLNELSSAILLRSCLPIQIGLAVCFLLAPLMPFQCLALILFPSWLSPHVSRSIRTFLALVVIVIPIGLRLFSLQRSNT